jgi:uncharacterized protein with von Willebrand factor type A (vWA) domain
MFVDFLFSLRRHGVPVGTQEWMALHRALTLGLVSDSDELYDVARAVLVHSEAQYDGYDLAFAESFRDAETLEIREAIKKWLEDPVPMKDLSPEAFLRVTGMSLDELRRRFEELLRTQKERHDGGRKWIGTLGTSPFGHSGRNPAGIRVGGPGGNRSAVQIAEERRFRNYRSDVTLDVRQWKVALRTLRDLLKEGPEELAVDPTIEKTSDQGGEIELVFERAKKNSVRLLLLMDTGGSMDPHARLVDQLFSAASEIGHWKSFHHYFFHNAPYSRIYTSLDRLESIPSAELLKRHPDDCKLVFVGDACMAPWELTASGGVLDLWGKNFMSGLDWIRAFKRRWKDAVWLNPEPERYWNHDTIAAIRNVVPMFPLTLDGMRDGIRLLRRGAPHAAKAG